MIKHLRINEKQHHTHQPKAVAVIVATPVYQEYSQIQLQKPILTRIKHKYTRNKPASSTPQLHWENKLCQYILSKQRVLARNQIQSTNFSFHRLDRMNRYRYIHLIQKQALPSNKIKKDLLDQQSMSNSRYMEKSKSPRFKISKLAPLNTSQKALITTSQKSMHKIPLPQNKQQKILTNFVQKYFKSKYGQSYRSTRRSIKDSRINKNPFLSRVNTQ